MSQRDKNAGEKERKHASHAWRELMTRVRIPMDANLFSFFKKKEKSFTKKESAV